MLDVNFIRKNQSLVEKSAHEKGYEVDLPKLLKIDDRRKELLQQIESLRRERNDIAAKMKGGKPSAELIATGKDIKEKIARLEPELDTVQSKLSGLLKKVPNIIFDDVPLGGEECSVEVRNWGEKKSEGVDHLDYATERGWLDFERGAKVAGAKFYYLRDGLALLENALLQFGLKKVLEHGFHYMTVPDMVSSKILEGCGFNPRSSAQSDEYFIEGEDLAMIATAEMPLTGFHMDEIIDEKIYRFVTPDIVHASAKKLVPMANIHVACSASINSTSSKCMFSVYPKNRKKCTKKSSKSKKRFGKS